MFFFNKSKKESKVEEYSITPQEYFQTYKWVKIENFINPDACKLLDFHIKMSAERFYFLNNVIDAGHTNFSSLLSKHYMDCPNCSCKGSSIDVQAPGNYSRYGEPIFDDMLNLCTSAISNYIGIELVPTYSYHRLYTHGSELIKHKDRMSCEYSATLCLGYDNSNLNENEYKDWNWPIFVEHNGQEIPVHLKPGDIMIYKGCEVVHWREPFIGTNQTQVFLHYNKKGDKIDNIYDQRPMLGLPLCSKKL